MKINSKGFCVRKGDKIGELGRAVPYGVYDIAGNAGWVSVGIDHDTAAFAANAIRSWWKLMGRERYPNASSLLITADGGGSNGSRVRLWKIELKKLADELGVAIAVCHLRPGTSKWFGGDIQELRTGDLPYAQKPPTRKCFSVTKAAWQTGAYRWRAEKRPISDPLKGV